MIRILSPVLVLATLLAAQPARGEDSPPPRAIRVSASSLVKAAPDRVRVSVSVVQRAATAREASEANANTSKAVLEKLKAAAGPAGEVATSGYELSPEYDYNQEGRPGRGPLLVGYVATNRFSIVTADITGVGALIDSAVASGANQIDSIAFFLEDEDKARRQALLQAGQEARGEAEVIAQSLGVSLGEVLEASSSSSAPPIPMHGREKMMAMDAAQAATDVVPGSLEIHAAVSVSFAIR